MHFYSSFPTRFTGKDEREEYIAGKAATWTYISTLIAFVDHFSLFNSH